MKQIVSDAMPRRTPESLPTGTQVSTNGASKQASGNLSAASRPDPLPIEEVPMALQLLTVLTKDWQQLPVGSSPKLTVSISEGRERLSTLRRLMVRGTPSDTLQIIQRLLAIYPRRGELADSVAEDWVRHLQPYPIASIWACYDRQIAKPGTFAPALGDFLLDVKRHAQRVETLGHRLAEALRSAEVEG